MELSKIGATQNSSFFYIPVSSSLTPEGMIVKILLSILDEITGVLVDENGASITDEFGNSIEFNNLDFYPEMQLFLWRKRIVPDWAEIQIVYLMREYL